MAVSPRQSTRIGRSRSPGITTSTALPSCGLNISHKEKRMKESGFEPPKVSDVLRAHFLQLEGVTQDKLAAALGVSRHSVNELMNDRRGVTAPMAWRLAHVLGTDPHFWMNLQIERDLFESERD